MSRPRRGVAPALLTLLLFWLVGYPLILTLAEALGAPHWTLTHVAEFARRPAEWQALWASLWISLATVVLAGAICVPLAFLFERNEFPGRGLLGALVALPVALPPLIGVLAFLFLYGESGFASRAVQALFHLSEPPWRLSGPGAILFVHAYSMYVYFYLFTRAGLARADASLLEAAASLGATRSRATWRITLPLLAPALAGAALLTFMTSLASFSAPYVFGGSFRVMTTQIVASKLNGDSALAMVETVALALIGFVGLALLRRAERRREVAGGTRGVAPRRRQLARGKWAATAAGWALAILLLLPHATLVLVSLVPRNTWTTEALPPVLDLGNYRSLFSETERLRPIVNSLWMASAATLLAILLGFAAASLAVRRKGRWSGPLETLIAAPWALPFADSVALFTNMRGMETVHALTGRRPLRFELGPNQSPALAVQSAGWVLSIDLIARDSVMRNWAGSGVDLLWDAMERNALVISELIAGKSVAQRLDPGNDAEALNCWQRSEVFEGAGFEFDAVFH